MREPAKAAGTAADAPPGDSGTWLTRAVLALHFVLAAMFVTVALLRMATPFDLEWLEGGMALQTMRLMSGEAIYTLPSLEWTPFIYPPGFHMAAAAAAAVGLEPLTAGRAVSLASTLGSAGLLFFAVLAGTKSRLAGALGAAMFLATFPLSGYFFDLNRVDALHLFLQAAACATVLVRPGGGGSLRALVHGGGAGLLMAAALLTKQTALPVALALAWPAWRQGRAMAIAYAATLLAGVGSSIAILEEASGGTFLAYVVALPARHPAPWESGVAALGELGRGLPIAGIVLATLLLLRSELVPLFPPAARAWAWPAAAALAGSVWARAHAASFANVLMPAHWFAVFLLAHLFGELEARARRDATRPHHLRRWLAAALLFQGCLLVYDPRDLLPPAGAAQQQAAFERTLAQAPGEVFFPDRPLAVLRAGHPGHAHGMALNDVARAGDERLPGVDLDAFYREKRFAAVIVRPDGITPALEENYAPFPQLTESLRSIPYPVTGWYSRQLYGFRARLRDDAP